MLLMLLLLLLLMLRVVGMMLVGSHPLGVVWRLWRVRVPELQVRQRRQHRRVDGLPPLPASTSPTTRGVGELAGAGTRLGHGRCGGRRRPLGLDEARTARVNVEFICVVFDLDVPQCAIARRVVRRLREGRMSLFPKPIQNWLN